MSSRLRSLWSSERVPLAAVVVVPLLLVSPALIPGRVLSSADLLLGTYMYAEARPSGFVPSNALIGDTVFQCTAWRPFAIRELRAGRLPFWNPHAFCGSPFLGNSQSAVFDILNLPYLVTGDPLGPTVWVALLRMWVAGLGTYLFARRLGLSRSGSALSAVAYECGGFMLVFLLFAHAASAAWFPWIMLAAEDLGTHGGGRPVVGLALALAASLFGGHVEVAFFAALAASFYAFVRRGQTRGWRAREMISAATGLASAGLLTALISAVHVVPLLDALAAGSSLQARAELAQQPLQIWPWQFPTSRLVLMFFPYLYGRPVHGEPSFPPAWTNFCEYSGAYVSFLALIMALFAIATARRRSATRPLGILWGLAWLNSVYFPPFLALARKLPVLDVGVPQRCVFVALFASAVLAGLGLDRLHALSGKSRRITDIALAGAMGAAACAALAVGWWLHAGARGLASVVRLLLAVPFRSVFVGREQKLQTGRFELAPQFASYYVFPSAVLMLGVAVWFLFEKRLGHLRGAAAVVLVAADLLWFGHAFNPAIPRDRAFPRTMAIDRLAGLAEGKRVLVLSHGLPPNCPMYYGISDILGYDAIGRQRLKRLLRVAGSFPPGPMWEQLVNFDVYESWVDDVLGVRAVASEAPLHISYLQPAFHQPPVYYYKNPRAFSRTWCPTRVVAVADEDSAERALRDPALDPQTAAVVESAGTPKPAAARGTLLWARPNPSRIVIDAVLSRGGVIVVGEAYDLGWTAKVDGSSVRVHPCDLALMALAVPPGTHQVTLVYRPPMWFAAVTLSMLGLVVAICMLGYSCLRPTAGPPLPGPVPADRPMHP
jgi:hypothetical protein